MAITKKRFYPRALNVISARLESFAKHGCWNGSGVAGCSVHSKKIAATRKPGASGGNWSVGYSHADGGRERPSGVTRFWAVSNLPINVRSWALVRLTTTGLRQPHAPAASHSAGSHFWATGLLTTATRPEWSIAGRPAITIGSRRWQQSWSDCRFWCSRRAAANPLYWRSAVSLNQIASGDRGPCSATGM